MAAVMSPQSSSTSPPPRAGSSNPNLPSLPPLITSPTPRLQRAPSYASKRLSTFSNASQSNSRSRPTSIAYPLFHSSLPYTLVRDFAYGPLHPLFYGPLPDNPSELSTPASEVNRRLSDPPPVWDGARGGWSAAPWEPGEQLPRTAFDNGRSDGPPWSEDEDIHSPVVTSTRHHKKHKSNVVEYDRMGNRYQDSRGGRGAFAGTNGDGSRTYYVSDVDESANGPGGEYITYPPSSAHSASGVDPNRLAVPSTTGSHRRDSHFAATLPSRSYAHGSTSPDTPQQPPRALQQQQLQRQQQQQQDAEMASPTSPNDEEYYYEDEDEDGARSSSEEEDSRLSRSYEFTITDPAEEFHGKAVALFDFARENDNELPLVEGQVILVSYRHGQGWLVAQDPKTGESGLVPEEYVRLLRDIKGGWKGWVDGGGGGGGGGGLGGGIVGGAVGQGAGSSGNGVDEAMPDAMDSARTPTQAEHRDGIGGGSAGGSYYTPIVSTFSTSSKDFEQPMHIERPEGKKEEHHHPPPHR